VKLAALLLLAGCDRFLELAPVKVKADGGLDASPLMIVQSMTNGNENAGSLEVTLGQTPATGDMLIAIVGAQNGVAATGVTGAANWQRAAFSEKSPTVYIYIGRPNNSGPVVTVTAKQAGQIWMSVVEWGAIDQANAIDTGNGTGGAGTGTLDVAITTSHAPDLVIFAVSSFGTIDDPTGTGMWTGLPPAGGSTINQRSWWQLADTAGAVDGRAGYHNDYDAALAAFRTTL
jgi:hypothetical protein